MYERSQSRRTLALLCGILLAAFALVSCGRKTAVPEADIARITAEEVRQRLDGGEVITFVDSRSSSSWAAAVARIPGAVRVPPHDIAGHISLVPRGNPVVVYCT